MLSSVTLTYSRYGQAPSLLTPRREAAQQAQSQSTFRPATGLALGQNEEVTHMRDLVERLNHRLQPAGAELRFSVEERKRDSRILMSEGDQTVASFGRGDLDLLEARLHDMAGFHLSIVT
jgi:hypothetical protein